MFRFLCTLLIVAGSCPARADVPNVVADIFVVQSLVQNVMGDLGASAVLATQGAGAHDLQLRPSQIAALSEADLLVQMGDGLSPALDQAIAANSPGQTLSLLDVQGTRLRRFEGGAIDPHAWMDPANVNLWLVAIAEALAKADPDHAAAYRANAAAAVQSVDAVAAQVKAQIAPLQGQVVVGHDAYGYFADWTGLRIAATVQDGDAALPGAARIQAVGDALARGQVHCIFPEAGHDPAIEQSLASESGAKLGAPLDPEGVSIAPGPALYTTILSTMGAAIEACLKG